MKNGQMKVSTLVGAAIVTVALVSSIAEAQIRYVDDDAPSGGDGTTWTTAYRYLQDALANAAGISEIRVAQGTYQPDRDEANPFGTGDRAATFQLVSGLALRGGYAGAVAPDPDAHDVNLYETILTGDIGVLNDVLDNSLAVVSGGSSLTGVIDGFTITAGTSEDSSDAGMVLTNSSAFLIEHCKFTENNGTAAYAAGQNTFSWCVFTGNTAQVGTTVFAQGSATFMNCIFSDNVAQIGGALFLTGKDSVTNCVFSQNTSPIGSAIYAVPDIDITNCAFVGNSGSPALGGLAAYTITNCVFTGNTGVCSDSATFAHFTNCVLWNNIPQGLPEGVAEINYSDVEGGWTGAGTGNIDADPLFVDAANEDFRLLPGSPCIDAGHNWAVPSDSADLDGDGNTTELTPLDLDGSPRFTDDPATIDTGSGIPVVVDMGAYEFPGVAASCIFPNDATGDGTVNVLDLIDLLLCFGQVAVPPSPCSLADFNVDGIVNVLDLIDLLLAFGSACPTTG